MRVADVDAYGAFLNTYASTRRLSSAAPAGPWAVNLAGRDGHYRLLPFDFDAHDRTLQSDAAAAAIATRTLLEDAGFTTVLCESSPGGGRHLWAASTEPIPATTVRRIALAVKRLHPTLDVSPLTNPATGAVRPPGAPHRHGGHSRVLEGELTALTAPTGTIERARALMHRLELLSPEPATPPLELTPGTKIAQDDAGHPFIAGRRRPLPAHIDQVLHTVLSAADDASAILYRLLLSAAAAHWQMGDIAAIGGTAPGLEYLRSRRERAGQSRRARPSAERSKILAREWARAVKTVATTTRVAGDVDEAFAARLVDVTESVDVFQQRATASSGRWLQRGGAADRRVLDALSILALQAVQRTLEVDVRRLALMAGIGRETARTALQRLAADGWISRAQDAAGPHAAHWQIPSSSRLHREEDSARSQGGTPPEVVSAAFATRADLLDRLNERVTAAAHDLFTYGKPALGLIAGNVYAHVNPEHGDDELTIAESSGIPIRALRPVLGRLQDAGALVSRGDTWRRASAEQLDRLAHVRGVAGRTRTRGALYKLERDLWDWWRYELERMNSPRRRRAPERADAQLTLVPRYGPPTTRRFPRQPDGRADFRAARAILTALEAGEVPESVETAVDPADLIRDMLGGILVEERSLPRRVA